MKHSNFHPAPRAPALAVAIALAACGGPASDLAVDETQAALFPPSEMVHDVDATTVSEFQVRLTAGTTVSYRTFNVTGGSPLLHLIDDTGREVAKSTHLYLPQYTRLTFTPTTTGWYTLVARSRFGLPGTCSIEKDGVQWQAGVVLGGTRLTLPSVRWFEEIQTVRLPDGTGPVHVFYLMKPDGVSIDRRVYGGGLGGAARLIAWYNLGDRDVIVSAPKIRSVSNGLLVNTPPGPVRLIRNDAYLGGHDADQDGLGYELEQKLGTCPARSGWATGPDGIHFDCSTLADARDTDGDGISDRAEVFGVPNGNEPLLLPLWGADPRHKDMFVEVDFMRRTQQENIERTMQRMPPEVAREFAWAYSDAVTTEGWAVAYNALQIRNPDGQLGINVHLDTGVEPTMASDATIYGDWGGFNAVDAVLNEKGEWVGAKPQDRWETEMDPVRRGIFRYHLAYGDGGGSQGERFAASYNLNSPYIAVHETAHSLGLGHSGPMTNDPIDVNCKPNFLSIMNYAFSGELRFSGGLWPMPMNNAALYETGGVSDWPPEVVAKLRSVFDYEVDVATGSVDWNRDGVFAPAGTTVRAYANYAPGAGCEYTRYNKVKVGGESEASPSLARIGNRTYVFYPRDGRLKFRHSTSSFDCPTPSVSGCAGASWSGEGDAGMNAEGADVTRITGADPHLLVVTVDADGNLLSRQMRLNGSSEIWSSIESIDAGVVGEPTLVSTDAAAAYVMYKNSASQVRFDFYSVAASWRGPIIARDGNFVPLAASTEDASPALFRSVLEPHSGSLEVYAAVPSTNNVLKIYRLNEASQRYEEIDIFDEPVTDVRGRPALAYVPHDPATPLSGRTYLLYTRPPVDGVVGTVRMLMSYRASNGNPYFPAIEEKIGLAAHYDNAWFGAFGLDLLFEPGVDTNLRAVFVEPKKDDKIEIWFRPNADGIFDHTYENEREWVRLGTNLCAQVVNPGGTVSNPISCLPRAE